MERAIQGGAMCPNCGDILYSNSTNDYTECLCEAIWIDGGMTPKVGSHGLVEPVPISREVDRQKLPVRYRLEPRA